MTPEEALAAIGDPDAGKSQAACVQALAYQQEERLTHEQIAGRFKEIYNPRFTEAMTKFHAGSLFDEQLMDYDGPMSMTIGHLYASAEIYREIERCALAAQRTDEFETLRQFYLRKMMITTEFRSACLKRGEDKYEIKSYDDMKPKEQAMWHGRMLAYNRAKELYRWTFEPTVMFTTPTDENGDPIPTSTHSPDTANNVEANTTTEQSSAYQRPTDFPAAE